MDKKVGIEGMGVKGSYNIAKVDQDMSVEHLKDRLEFNLRHAEDHLKEAKLNCERLHNVNEEPTIPKSIIDSLRFFTEEATHKDSSDNKLKKVGKNMAQRTK